jgi:hypothetical protein
MLMSFQTISSINYAISQSSSCSRYNANFKLDQSVLAIHDSPLYYEISEDDHPPNHRTKRGNPRPRLLMNFRLC